jgi:hypothetical protein
MDSIFLEGLKTARNLLKYGGGVARLDELIKEHENGTIETAAVRPLAETR